MEINRIQLKKYFETGKRPTQSNFANLIDSLALVSEIPQREEKPYSCVSLLLNCNGLGPSKPIITHTLLENTLTNLNFHIIDNCISITSSDTFFEFNLERIFISIGILNDTCRFDKVVFSLNESTNTELVLYCETIIETNTKEPGDLEPDIPGGFAISFQQLPIDIRVYDESLDLIENDINLRRYKPYIRTKSLKREENLLIPPYRFFTPVGEHNNSQNGSNTDDDIAVWKRMPDKYLVLPEINTDNKKNPHVYNLRTKEFGCYYSYIKNWMSSYLSTHFLKNSVKKARKTGATECIVNLGSDSTLAADNIRVLKLSLISGNNNGIERISLVINNVISHYTREEILVL